MGKDATVYGVGLPYDPEHREPWEEGAMYVYHGGIHQVLFFFNRIKPIEEYALKRGLLRFGLYVEDEVITLLCRSDVPNDIPVIGWHDMPYSWHLVAEEIRTLPKAPEEVPANLGALVMVFLIDASTGIVRVLRQVNWSHDFTVQLYAAIHAQALMPFDREAYLRKVNAIRKRYPTPEDVASHTIARCVGGINEAG